MSYIKVFNKDGKETRWSKDAHKRIIDGHVIVADVDIPSRKCILDKFGLADKGRLSLPGDWIASMNVMLAILNRLHDRGIISDGRYDELSRDLLFRHSSARDVIAAAKREGLWVRAIVECRFGMRGIECEDFDYSRDGIAWAAPGEITEGDPNEVLDGVLEEIRKYETGVFVCYTVRIAPVEKMDDGAWKATGEFRIDGEGISKDVIGNYMAGMPEDGIKERYERARPEHAA